MNRTKTEHEHGKDLMEKLEKIYSSLQARLERVHASSSSSGLRTVTARTDAAPVLDPEKGGPTWMQKEAQRCNGDDERCGCDRSDDAGHRRSSRGDGERRHWFVKRRAGEEGAKKKKRKGQRYLKAR